MQAKTKQDWFYPTAYSSWDEEEKLAIVNVLASGRLTMGEQVEAFEEEFARWHGMKHAIMVNSGSSANLIAVAAFCQLRLGGPNMYFGRVIVPAIAWSTTYAPLIQHGMEPVVADVNDQWNVGRLDKQSLLFDSSVNVRPPRLQIVCSILGNPAHFWDEAPWTIIEDNCEALGAVDLKGRKCGTRGLMNTFSLFWSHQLSAVEGGVILTNDDDCNRMCRMLRAHGWTRDLPDPQDRPGTFEYEYDFRVFGYNVRPLEMHAAVARVQLKKLPQMIDERRKNVSHFRLRAMQEGLPLDFPTNNGQQSPFGIHFELRGRSVAERGMLAVMLRHSGIDCRLPTGGSFTRHIYGSHWKNYPTPRADKIHDCGMFLGCAPFPIPEQIERAIRVMVEVLKP